MSRLITLIVAAWLACGQAAAAPYLASAPERAALEDLAEDLHDSERDVDRLAARLALSLADGAADTEVRRSALALILAVRASQLDGDTGRIGSGPGRDAEVRAVMARSTERLDRARLALRRGAYLEAIELLEMLHGTPAWTDAEPFWVEAVDAWVGQERERAGELYQAAQRLPRVRRRAELLEVRGLLADLIDDYPESAYADALSRNLERVERELELLE